MAVPWCSTATCATRQRRPRSREVPDIDGVELLTIFVLSIFVGFEVVSKVSTILHTPLMSGANAIHGIVLIGGITVTGAADSAPEVIIGVIAILLGAINLVGGFAVTDRMLEMFKSKAKVKDEGAI
jgi:NAD(P) transhydrogenase subunit alpha